MFAKFATAKNRKKLNSLKLNANRCYMPAVQNTTISNQLICTPTAIMLLMPGRELCSRWSHEDNSVLPKFKPYLNTGNIM